MIILCTHNNGGVGKTTLAVHVAGILMMRQQRTFLVDCDDQADFWRFHTGHFPTKPKDQEIYQPNNTVIWNKSRDPIESLIKKSQYDHVVLDINSPLQNTVQTIVGSDPDLILVPINISQEEKALLNLPRTLKVISNLEVRAGSNPQVIIVPLGISKNSIDQVVDRLDYDNKPRKCKVFKQMDDCQSQMQKAIYKERQYIWDYDDWEYLYDYFADLLDY